MPEPMSSLRVNPVRLAQAGATLQELATQIPHINPGFTVTGTDPLTQAVAAKIPTLEAPVVGS